MSQLRLEVPIDPARVRDDPSAEQTLREISARFVPGLESAVGAIDYRHGDRTGVTWSTEGWLSDETFVSLAVDVGSSELQLFMDTCGLRSPRPPMSRAYTAALVASMVIASGGAAWRFRALWPTVGALVGVLALWVVSDVIQQARNERIARRRVLDEADWRRRLTAALG
jgi:hypothetical protein